MSSGTKKLTKKYRYDMILVMTKRKIPDYSFKSGLRADVYNYADDGVTSQLLRISPEELMKTPNIGDNPSRDAKVAERMSSPRLVRGLGGVTLETVVIGSEDAEDVMFISYGWGGNVRHPVAIREAQALAANNPDSQLVFSNTFGTGRSSMLPKSVARELRRTGSYSPVGEYVASIYDQLSDGRAVHLRGHSLGGRTAVGAAPYLDNSAETLIINDPTGTRKMSLAGIAMNFAFREGQHLGEYAKSGFDPESGEVQLNPGDSKEWSVSDPTKDGWKQQFLVDPSGLSKASFESDFTKSVPTVSELIRIISPELSELNKPEAVADILSRSRDIEGSKPLLEQYILRDHTHSVVTVPQVLARLYKNDITV